MINIDALYEAIALVFTWQTLIWIAIGVTIGVGVGAMPVSYTHLTLPTIYSV